MQKKIMLVLIIGNAAMVSIAQEGAPAQVVTPLVAESQPAQAEAKPLIAPENAPVAQPETVITQEAPQLAPAISSEQKPVEQQVPTSAPTPQPASQPVAQEQPAPMPPAAQPMPAPVEQPKKEVAPAVQSAPESTQEDEIEIKGIDTVEMSEAKGNWLYKRIWWEKAERLYEKIKQLTDKILESRMVYFARRTDLDRTILDPFYLSNGFSQGELNEIISYFTKQLDQERKEEGTLTEKERELLNAITEEKKSLEQLQLGVNMITKVDHALDDAIMKLVEQLNQAKYYEQQAWENFKAINRELSDKKARELYYGMDTYWRNLNNINTYLSDSFSKYFDQLSDKIKQEVDTIKTTMDALKEKGIDIQMQAQKMKSTCKLPEEPEKESEKTSEQGFLGTLFGWIKAPFVAVGDLIGGAFGWVAGLFGGSTEEITLARPERGAKEASAGQEEGA